MRDWPDFYDPELYDLEIGLGRRVSGAYESLLQDGAADVLELGCGTGEIVTALAAAGHQVTGIDLSQPMLDAASRRVGALAPEARARVRLEQGSMTDIRLDARFDVVVLANDMVNHALDVEELVATFATGRHHLLDAGSELFFDVLHLDVHQLSRAAGPDSGVRHEIGLFPVADSSRSVRVSETTRFDPESWIRESIFDYEHISPRGTVDCVDLRRLVQRPWTRTELLLALSLAGFGSPQPFVDDSYPERWFCRAAVDSGASQ